MPSSAYAACLFLLCLSLSACAPPGVPSARPASGRSEPTATVETSPGVSPSNGSLGSLAIRLEPVAQGFDRPVFLTHAGDGSGRMFVVEQGGRVRVVRSDGSVSSRPFLDLSKRVSTGGERGLLGLAFSPEYKTNGRLYVDYTDRNGDTIIARLVADPPASDSPSVSAPEVVLKVRQPYANHNGGCIVFAPDGTLWVGMGDGGSAGDPEKRAQDPNSRLGKMLALDVEAQSRPAPKIVMQGLRNPWRFSFDPATEDVWIGDVGQNAWEEVDVIPFAAARGKDLGWSDWEGTHPYPPDAKRKRTGVTFPAFEYSHKVGESVTGGYVYRGSANPGLVGAYIFGDFVSGWIGIARANEGGAVEHRIILPDAGVTPASFGVDEAGNIYVCDYDGAILRIVGD